MLLAIDSGANLGWALFSENKSLVACGLKQMPDPDTLPAPITRIVVEKPHAGKTRARAKDILTLAVRAGEVGGIWSYITGVTPEYIEPQRWKGQLPKKRCNEIVEAKLTPQEMIFLNKIKPASAKHNVLDAIGIGLFIAGR
jgi:hypothetical protein